MLCTLLAGTSALRCWEKSCLPQALQLAMQWISVAGHCPESHQ